MLLKPLGSIFIIIIIVIIIIIIIIISLTYRIEDLFTRINNNEAVEYEGVIVGFRTSLVHNDYISWNSLIVEWYDNDNETNANIKYGQFVNPWEIKLTNEVPHP